MDCPHCGMAFHDIWEAHAVNPSQHTRQNSADKGERIAWTSRVTTCPACGNATIHLAATSLVTAPGDEPHPIEDFRAYPQNTFRKPTHTEVPTDMKEDYEEACKVLLLSNKASAALSRRCLQAILQGQGYAQKDLAVQYQWPENLVRGRDGHF